MSRIIVSSFILLALVARLAAAEGPTPAGDKVAGSAEANDTGDLLYLGDDQFLFLRLHIRVDGVSYAEVWERYVEQFFNELDDNHDAVLSVAEVTRLVALSRQVPGLSFLAPRNPQSLPSPDTTPLAGRTTKVELAAYLRRNAGGPLSMSFATPVQFRASVLAQRAGQPSVPDLGLFGRLDQNQDGKLAKEEFAISAALRKRDLDDDETISNAELQPLRSAYGYYEDYARPQRATQPASFVSLNDADSPTKLVRQLLHKYDRSGSVLGTSGATPAMDSKLSRDELGLDLQVFQTFDADGDGQLDFDELRQLFRNPGPTLEVTVRLGQRKLDEPTVEIVPAKASSGALPVGLRQSADGVATLILGKVQIEVGAVSATESAENTRQIYAQRFKAVDADNNGYLELKEVEQRGYPKEVFELIDRDGDSKVFEKELSAFYVQQHAAMQSRVVLEVSDDGHNLFQIVDVNRDGRLTQRELARAAKRIAAWDENGDGAVTEAEIPRSYRLTLARGTLYGSRTFPAVSYDAAGQPLSRPSAGPLWFEKMDRNRDGDVSRREFLGSHEDFRQFDANADGLIDAAEAAKAK